VAPFFGPPCRLKREKAEGRIGKRGEKRETLLIVFISTQDMHCLKYIIRLISSHRLNFYRAMLSMRGSSHGPVSVCVCHKSPSRCSTETAKRRITQTAPHDSQGNLVFWRQRSPRNFTAATRMGTPNAGGVRQNRRLSTNNRLYLENDFKWHDWSRGPSAIAELLVSEVVASRC